MIYKTVYDTTGLHLPTASLVFLTISVIGIIIIIYIKKHSVNFFKSAAFWAILVLICFVIGVLALVGYIDCQQNIYIKYINNNYQIVEGEIQEFHAMPAEEHDSEHFYVNRIYFSYPDSTGYGYSKCKKDGGYITGNGEKVKISYITYQGNNIILKLEVGQNSK